MYICTILFLIDFLDDHILYNILLGWIKLLPQKSLI